ASLLINDCFLCFSASFLVSMNLFSVSKAFALLSLLTCKFLFFLPLSDTLIFFIISFWIVVVTFSVFNLIVQLYMYISKPVPPPALICTDKNRSAPHLLASSVLLFKDTFLSVFLLIFTVTSL